MSKPALRVRLGRRYGFCAAHRLFRPEWENGRNEQEYGKCANPFGHGHNYMVEVLVSGEVDPVSGTIVDLAALDAMVAHEVLEPLDHSNLNLQPTFAGRVPTSENVCVQIFERLQRALQTGTAGPVKLEQVRLEETRKNAFTYRAIRAGVNASEASEMSGVR